MEIRALTHGDQVLLAEFLRRIPVGDRTFFKERVDDADASDSWLRDGGARWLAVDGDIAVGYVAVVPLHGLSDHVGEIRLIVDPKRRRAGLGTALARHGVIAALQLGLSKLVVEALATQEYTIEMFRSLGFEPEALLTGQVRSEDGRLLDLMILAQSPAEVSAVITAAGVDDALAS